MEHMVTLFHMHAQPPREQNGARSWFARTPHGRLMQRRTRRLLAAVCAALGVICALECVLSAVATQPVVVAERGIARGTIITAADVRLEQVPDHAALRGALHATSDAVDALAQVDVGAGDVLLPSMVGTRPTVPEGHTVIDVRLGDQQEPFPTGTSIQLASVVGCDEPETTLCTLSTQAVVMAAAHLDDATGMHVTPVAMPADDAVRVLAVQNEGPIIAVQGRPQP